MTELQQGSDDRRRRLELLLEEYIERVHRGEEIEPLEVLEAHPDLAPDLLRELDTYESVESDVVGAGACADRGLGTLGDYTLRRQIGRGGMGVVYDAWQNSMGRQVALKVLPAGLGADRRAAARFMREAQTAGQLNHENVVRVYSTGVEEGTPWYAMEYVEGETLASVLARVREAEDDADTPFGVQKGSQEFFLRLARCFGEVADGLQHAHSRGIIHRDVKPSNLILDSDGRLRILDFGLARLEGQESLTLTGDLVGTPLYMSPEQARRRQIAVDHRTDVYSLGATMYEALCSRPPFRGRTHADTLSRIIEHEPIAPRSLNPRLPKDLETIVLKCLRKEPQRRYGTAEALAQDLRRFVRGDPVEARPQAGWERLARRARPYRGRILAMVALLTLLSLVGGGLYLRAEKNRHDRVARAEAAVMRHLGEAGSLWREAIAEAEDLSRLRDALAAAEAAAALAISEVSPSLRKRATSLRDTLRKEVRNRDMLARLDQLPAPTEYFEKREAKHHAGFAKTFREYGIDVEELDPEVAAGRIRQSGIATELALALEIWSKLLIRPTDAGRGDRLIEIAMRADPDPWRNRLRRAVRAGDIDEARSLAESIDVEKLSDRRIAFLAAHLFHRGQKEAAESLLRRAHDHIAFEDSYWTHYWLGFLLKQDGALEESEICFRAAIHHRPEEQSGRVRAHLGDVLTRRGQLEKAVEAYVRALHCVPGDGASYGGLAALIRRLHEDEKADALDRVLGALNEAVTSGRAATEGSRALVEAWILQPQAIDAENILEVVGNLVDESGEKQDEPSLQRSLVLLARAQFHAGQRREAVRTLEAASRLVGREDEQCSLLLEEYRTVLRPNLVTCASIDAALEQGEALVPLGAQWRFLEGRQNPHSGLEWTHVDFDDRAWKTGRSGFGYGDGDDATALKDMRGSYTSLYIRHRFHLAEPSAYKRFILSVRVDDGCIVYVNGHEVGRIRAGSTGDKVEATDVAETTAPEPVSFVNLTIPRERLQEGDNVLAMQGLNRDIDSSDFSLIPILYAKAVAEKNAGCFEEFRRVATRDGENGEARLSYLEGELHARGGEHKEALEAFLEVLEANRTEPAPYLGLWRSRQALGDVPGAEEALRELLEQVRFPAIQHWNHWIAFNFVALERTPEEVLEALAGVRSHGYADDLRWLVESLARNGAVRINCGGSEYESAAGHAFGRDRFFRLGEMGTSKIFSDRIARTDDDPLYASWRYFVEDPTDAPGYVVPLPPGRYRLTLHFAIVYPPAGAAYESRNIRPPGLFFDVLAEGQPLLEEFAPLGYASADVQSFTLQVDDGALDLELVDRGSLPLGPVIEGLEIERLE